MFLFKTVFNIIKSDKKATIEGMIKKIILDVFWLIVIE